MKIKFKLQEYQTNATDAVVDCFSGQLFNDNISYRIDPGEVQKGEQHRTDAEYEGFKNTDLQLSLAQVLDNIREVQRRQNIPLSEGLSRYWDAEKNKPMPARYIAGSDINLDIEMETGTGKTYCYIKTIFEMNKRYGWSKFIIMVPSVAIRESVYKSLQMTAEHFTQGYGKKARFFIYNSKHLHELESFSSDAGINIMVINIQAFNASGADNRPIVILDEPQKMQGAATQRALPKFNPLFILRYSATHKVVHNRIHRLDALDAYNQKLVKKIAVRGIQMRGLSGTGAYLYLESIEISRQAPKARLEMEVKLATGEIKRQVRLFTVDTSLYDKSNRLDQYRGFTISQIDYNKDAIEFTNGVTLTAGEATGDVNETHIRRIQIRETIKAHLEKEKQLFAQGIKVLSLFFIDEVAKYRDYDQADKQGEYARVFEEEYEILRDEYLSELALDNEDYRKHLAGIETGKTHNGYFSIDKKTKRLTNPKTGARSVDSDDVDAYDLILKDKELLLSFDEPTRFIFSHSALREGWDNPNVFAICMLKHSDNSISRRQEVGRGLRLSVDSQGDRIDHPARVHEINELTVVASESYKDFVAGLQREISEAVAARPKKANQEFFCGKFIESEAGKIEIDEHMARQIYRYLLKNDYIDDDDLISARYIDASNNGALATMPDELGPYTPEIIKLIDSLCSDAASLKIGDGRKPKKNPLNDNFDKKEFQELWNRINKKAVYRVEFDSDELVGKCIRALDSELRVTPLQYRVHTGEQKSSITDEQLRTGKSFKVTNTKTEQGASVHSQVKYDLLGKLSEQVQLKRKTIAEILTAIPPAVFGQFKQNPEHFIAEASRLINEQKASMVIERLQYSETDDSYDVDIFMASQSKQNFSKAGEKLKRHVYDYAITDSQQERKFVTELDTSDEVVVYAKLPNCQTAKLPNCQTAKLPNGFLIPTPVGDYKPDWAISFKEGRVKHIYFVAETKGSMSSIQLREVEQSRIKCARKYFDEINKRILHDQVKYDVVTDYGKLMDIVGVS